VNNRFKGVFKDTPTYIDVSTGYCQEIKGTIYYTEAFVNCLKQENQQLKSTLEEIREYIKEHISYEKNADGDYEPYLGGYGISDLLQIIDKGVNNE